MPYTTTHEVKFLQKIGTYSLGGKNPIKCLKGYIKAAKVRENWGMVKKETVIKMAEAMLSSMEPK